MIKNSTKTYSTEEAVIKYFKMRAAQDAKAKRKAFMEFLKDAKAEDKTLSSHDRNFYCVKA